MSPPVITGTIGLIGVLLGLVARPFVEELFKRRRESLYLEVEKETTSLLLRGEKGLKLKINDQDVDRVFARDFVIRNRTGRTLRGFTLTLILEYQQGVADQRRWIDLFKSSDAEVSGTVAEDQFTYSFERFDRNGKIAGRFLSTYIGRLRGFTDTDLEVFVGDRARMSHPSKMLEMFWPMLLYFSLYAIYFIAQALIK